MIKLLVVAGSTSNKLADFLVNRGTFEVDYCYNSLTESVDSIQNQIIKTEKMLYLYRVDENTNTSQMNIKSDMQILRSLIMNSGFFSPGEIIFIANKSELSNQAVNYFTTVMKDCGKSDYRIDLISGNITFSDIYDSIMGVSVTKDFHNTFKKIYRVERNAEANLAYVGSDDHDLIIEPFKYDSLAGYETRKNFISKTDSGYVNVDSADTNLGLYSDPSFGQLDFTSVLNQQKVVLVSGDKKSGKTVWSVALAKSAVEAGKTTCVIDFTRNSDVEALFQSKNIVVNSMRMIDFLKEYSVSRGSLSVVSIHSENEYSVRLEFLQNIFSRKLDTFDTVFIMVDLENLESVFSLLNHVISDLLITTISLVPDVMYSQEVLHRMVIDESIRISFILNEDIVLLDTDSYLKAEEVKEIVDERVRVVRAKHFNNINTNAGVYTAIIGG